MAAPPIGKGWVSADGLRADNFRCVQALAHSYSVRILNHTSFSGDSGTSLAGESDITQFLWRSQTPKRKILKITTILQQEDAASALCAFEKFSFFLFFFSF
jgi:hypothetical protein